MRIYYDTEFIEDGSTIDLISIGMVAEDGRELYCINGEGAIGRALRHDWLRQNVLPHLPIIIHDEPLFDMPRWFEWDEDDAEYGACVWNRETIRAKVYQFILETPNPQLWSWYPAYDHVVLAQLFGTMADLPDQVPMTTFDLEQERVRLGAPMIRNKSASIHNALSDALWHRDLGGYLSRYEMARLTRT